MLLRVKNNNLQAHLPSNWDNYSKTPNTNFNSHFGHFKSTAINTDSN